LKVKEQSMDALFKLDDSMDGMRGGSRPRYPHLPHAIGRRPDEPVHVRDVPSLLLKERILFVAGLIGSATVDLPLVSPKDVISVLLYLEGQDSSKDIHMYIHSYGALEGYLYYDILGIYDTMQAIKPEISTYCVGIAMGASVALLAGGTPGKRFCLPHSQVVLHQPAGQARGQASDIDIRAREIARQRQLFYEVLAKHSNQTPERIKADSDRMNYMTAEQALEYGLVDEIISPPNLP
jgi:ATP-dependent Clp protease protease subunit